MARLVLVSAICSLCASAAAHAEVFRYKFHPGQVISSRLSLAGATMAGQTAGQMTRMQFRTSSKQVQRVQYVSGGVVSLEVTDLPGTYTMSSGGQTQSSKGTATKTLIRLTERGKFISRKSLSGGSEQAGASQLDGLDAVFGLNFPAHDIKPGDTWDDTITVGEGLRAKKVHVTWKYLSRETFRARDCARIHASVSVPLDTGELSQPGMPATQGRISGTVVTYFDPKVGQEIYSSGSIVVQAKADLSGVSPEAGEIATVSKINLVQSLLAGGR